MTNQLHNLLLKEAERKSIHPYPKKKMWSYAENLLILSKQTRDIVIEKRLIEEHKRVMNWLLL